MGTDVHSSIWVGARVLREELLVPGEEVLGCLEHGEMKGKCCSECGTKLSTVALEVPTELLKGLTFGRAPAWTPVDWDNIGELFDGLEVDYAEGKYRYPGPYGPSPHIDLGIRIVRTDSSRSGGDGRAAFNPDDVTRAVARVAKVLTDGGLGHLKVGCFVVSTISC